MIMPLTLPLVAALLPPRPHDGHKGTFGHIFLLAGSRRYPGALRLAGEAACRSGVGLATAGFPESLRPMAAMTLLECMGLALPETGDGGLGTDAIVPALAFAADKDSVVLGPGLATHPESEAFVHHLIPAITAPLLIDADGLNHLASQCGLLSERKVCHTVITPHPGEMARLCGKSTSEVQAQRPRIARDFATAYQVIVVLKGFETVVAHPDGTLAINTTGNNGMATGGTGDILAGLIGGFLAQGVAPWDAARLGVWVHGYAGDCAAREFTARAMIARDVLASIPKAFAALESHG